MKKNILTLFVSIFFACSINAQSLKILFVDDTPDNFGNAEKLRAFVDSVGYKSTLYDAVTVGITPPYDTLKKYRLVIWHTASQGAGLKFWNDADQDNEEIKKYLDNGGNLWVIGNDFLYDRYSTPPRTFTTGNFPYEYLGISSYDAQSYGDDGSLGVPMASPVVNAPFPTLDTLNWNFATLWWADAVTVRTGAKTVYKMDGDAAYPLKNKTTAVFYNSGKFRTLSFFFDLVLAKDEKIKTTMKKVLDYFQLLSGTAEVNDAIIAAKTTPNPFKSSTAINFEVSESNISHVSICDIQGNEIDVLLKQQNLPVGKHSIEWYPSASLPAGVYFCKIQVGNNISTLKIVKN